LGEETGEGEKGALLRGGKKAEKEKATSCEQNKNRKKEMEADLARKKRSPKRERRRGRNLLKKIPQKREGDEESN